MKLHLDKTAFQTYCNLITKGSYSDVIDALCRSFQPVDIEELRGAEFTQTMETIEESGIKLQTVSRIVFTILVG